MGGRTHFKAFLAHDDETVEKDRAKVKLTVSFLAPARLWGTFQNGGAVLRAESGWRDETDEGEWYEWHKKPREG